MPPILRYFVVRPATEVSSSSGEVEQRPEVIVPLIPMDLIPEGIDIKGIPRQLTLTETMGMTHVGSSTLESDRNEASALLRQRTGGSTSTSATANASSLGLGSPAHVAEPKASNTMSQVNEGSFGVGALSSASPPSMALPLTPTKTPTLPIRPSTESTTNDAGSPTGGHRLRPSRSGSRSPSDEPEEPLYCQPWCHHGKCSRGDSCRSKHEMPATLEGLKKVGLEKLPYWYSQSAKGRRQWQSRAKESWIPRKHTGRSSAESIHGPSTWSTRFQGNFQSYGDRVRAENIRALELMNRDNLGVRRNEQREARANVQVRDRNARESQDLISMDYPETLPHPVMDGTDR
jgi:hypothetical protein